MALIIPWPLARRLAGDLGNVMVERKTLWASHLGALFVGAVVGFLAAYWIL